jgi:hypothetical protein
LNVLALIRAGIALANAGGPFLALGEEALKHIRSAIADGRAATDTKTLEEAKALLASEEAQSVEASSELEAAIDAELARTA